MSWDISYSTTVVDAAEKQNDKSGNSGSRKRINGRDLFAGEGIHHFDCHKCFLLTHESIIGRSSIDGYVIIAIEWTQCLVEQNKVIQISLSE